MDAPRPRVSRAAYLLGFAGLLPQITANIWLASVSGPAQGPAIFLAYGYAGLILSFLGGIWWGFAMRRERNQAGLAVVAVLPSLLPLFLFQLAVATTPKWALVALGVAIIATLLVDRRLVATGEAPPNWMRLRAPLSLGLGGLTIVAGLLA